MVQVASLFFWAGAGRSMCKWNAPSGKNWNLMRTSVVCRYQSSQHSTSLSGRFNFFWGQIEVEKEVNWMDEFKLLYCVAVEPSSSYLKTKYQTDVNEYFNFFFFIWVAEKRIEPVYRSFLFLVFSFATKLSYFCRLFLIRWNFIFVRLPTSLFLYSFRWPSMENDFRKKEKKNYE